MPTAAELRRALGLPAGRGAAREWHTVEEAERLLPQVAPDKRRMAALALLAREWTQRPGDTALLGALREAATHPQPERELTRLLSRLTGAYVAIHASWGDLIAASGEARPGRTWTLRHGTRQVGTLTAAGDPVWTPLWPLAAEYALLARLQSAAAGAARRRVGERALDSLLAGQSSGPGTRVPGMGEKPFALAVARPSHAAGVGARAALAREQELDVLASAGEGYFTERRVSVHSTVRGGLAVWVWPTTDLPAEGAALHAALLASTARDVRLGASAARPLGAGRPAAEAVRAAFAEAAQALSGVRKARGYALFSELDPLTALQGSGALDILRGQVHAQLAALDDAGRTEATLRAFLAHPGSLGELAAQLHIHVNTLRYRLRRAEDALGAPLSDPRLLARLYLAFEETATQPAGRSSRDE